MKNAIVLGTTLTVMTAASAASAQTVYDWPAPEAPVAVHDGGALYFIGKDKSVWRVYKWKAASGTNKAAAFFTDMNGDSKVDVVGAGKPSFGLDTATNPVWFENKGCDQLLVADFAADDKKDFVCINGAKVEARTYDNQLIWSISMGKKYDWCVAGDINGDLKADVECKIRGSKKFSRVDGTTGDMLAAEADAPEVTDPKDPGIEPVGKGVLEGKESFDIDGDGTSEETLIADGNAVGIRSRSKKVGLGRIELKSAPVAAIVKDLDGDKKLDVVVVSKNEIAVWSAGDKAATTYPLSAAKYSRQPVADLQSVYANGFGDADPEAKKTVEDLNEKLAACYSSQVKKNQFAGVGRALVEVKVGKDGKVSKVDKHHSSLADGKVVDCAMKVLKSGKYPKPAGDAASVNVTMEYTFRDK